MTVKRAELLAPAGSIDSLFAAVNAGADAVYIGGSSFGARAYADNPDGDGLLEGLKYCHLHGAKMYLTVNTLLKERELEEGLYPYLAPLYEQGLDAVIVQDIGAMAYIREQFPGLELHASTQMSVTGALGCVFLEEQGASRIVLSREVGLGEIRQIRDQIHAEIEAFVHGALCYCYSGQCLFSSVIGGRSGNRGRCAQPCRLPYTLTDGKRNLSGPSEPYLMSPKDICTLDILPDILEAGVFSLKIEGRMKRPEYTAGVVRIYRKYLDFYLKNGRAGYTVSEDDMTELKDLYNRGGFSRGYYEQHNGKSMMSMARPNHSGTRAAVVCRTGKDGIWLKALEPLYAKDTLAPAKNTVREERAGEFTLREAVREGREFRVKNPGGGKLHQGQILYRMKREQLLEELKTVCTGKKRQEKINGNLKILAGQPAILAVSVGDVRAKVFGDTVLAAKNRPLDRETLRKQIVKTGNTPFVFENLEISMEEGCFLPVQSLNDLRRQALAALERKILDSGRRAVTRIGPQRPERVEGEGTELSVSLENLNALDRLLEIPEVSRIYLDSACFEKLQEQEVLPYLEKCHRAGKECFYIMPWIFREELRAWYAGKQQKKSLFLFDGILIKNMEAFQFLKEESYPGRIFADHNVYTYNSRAVSFWRGLGVSKETAPLELNVAELKERGCGGSEMIVYGRIPVMVSAQCQLKNSGACEKRQRLVYLKDRKGKYFPVKNYCRPCYNVIYNSTVLRLEDCFDEIGRLHPASLRLSFTTESEQEIENITKRYAARFVRGEEILAYNGAFTRGHFKRGIE